MTTVYCPGLRLLPRVRAILQVRLEMRALRARYFAGGRFFEMLPLAGQPAFASPTLARPLLNPGIFVLLSMLPSAFGAHFNAARFYSDLAEPADGSSDGALSDLNSLSYASTGWGRLVTMLKRCGATMRYGVGECFWYLGGWTMLAHNL